MKPRYTKRIQNLQEKNEEERKIGEIIKTNVFIYLNISPIGTNNMFNISFDLNSDNVD